MRFEPSTVKLLDLISFFPSRSLDFSPRVRREWKQRTFRLGYGSGFNIETYLSGGASECGTVDERCSWEERATRETQLLRGRARHSLNKKEIEGNVAFGRNLSLERAWKEHALEFEWSVARSQPQKSSRKVPSIEKQSEHDKPVF